MKQLQVISCRKCPLRLGEHCCHEELELHTKAIVDIDIIPDWCPLPDVVPPSENQPSCLGAVIVRFNSDTFIDNVCLSYRHDFGLMSEQDRQRLRFECREWMRAISNNWEYFKNGL
jgi:hypothetical protein